MEEQAVAGRDGPTAQAVTGRDGPTMLRAPRWSDEAGSAAASDGHPADSQAVADNPPMGSNGEMNGHDRHEGLVAEPADEPFHVKPASPDAQTAHETQVPPRHFSEARVLTVANQKGGVGKTTTAVSLAAALADLQCRVLLIDLDPQGNATSGVGMRVHQGQPTVYDVLVDGMDVEDVIEPTSLRNLFLLPANIDLAGAEVELVAAFSRELKLRKALNQIRDDYDIIIIDCPPSLGLLTVNALSAADGAIVPIQCEYYALEGLEALRRNAELIRSNLNAELEITGYVMTMLDGRTRLSQQVVDEMRGHFGDKVFQTRIPRSVRLAEAPSFGQPITVFDPSSRGALAYRRLARELLARLDHEAAAAAPAGEGVR